MTRLYKKYQNKSMNMVKASYELGRKFSEKRKNTKLQDGKKTCNVSKYKTKVHRTTPNKNKVKNFLRATSNHPNL